MTTGMRPGADDWRRQGQERYLAGLTWSWQAYAPFRDGWEHDHCEFCGARLSTGEGDLREGYVSGGYHWVCETCFQDFRDEMGWEVAASPAPPTASADAPEG